MVHAGLACRRVAAAQIKPRLDPALHRLDHLLVFALEAIEAAGYQPGPEFGRILTAVEDAQLDGRIRTKEEALELARKAAITL